MEKKPLSIKEALKSGIIEQRTYQKAEQSRVGKKEKRRKPKGKAFYNNLFNTRTKRFLAEHSRKRK